MTFSILIPVYNTAQYLPKCLESILSQSFIDYEVICVDDGSTDDSITLLQDYALRDSRIEVVSTPNSGVSHARNIALDKARGDYVLFMDSDDWLADDALAKLSQWACAGQYDIVAFNTTKYIECNQSLIYGKPVPEEFQNGWKYYEQCSIQENDIPFGVIWGRIYSSSMLKKVPIRFNEQLQYNEDVLFTIFSCYYAGAVKVLDDSLYMYRVRNSGSLMATLSARRFDDMITFSNVLSAFFVPLQDIDKQTVFRTAASFYRNGLLWSSSLQRKSLRKKIDWKLFRQVSKVSKSSFFACLALLYAPKLAVPLINKMKQLK